MIKFHILTMAMILCIYSMVAQAADSCPQFAGTYIEDHGSSAPITDAVTQDGCKSLTISSQDSGTALTYILDGQPHEGIQDGFTVTTQAQFVDQTLVIEQSSTIGGALVKVTTTVQLDANNNLSLTLDYHDGKKPNSHVLKRQN